MNMIIKKEAATLERTSANEGVQLQSLTLSEGTIRFEPDVTDYNVTVAEDVTKILVKGVTNDENSFYTVSGNTNLVKGKNEIVVTVTDKDGNIGHYYIHVQVGEQKEQTSQSDSQSQTNQAAQSCLLYTSYCIQWDGMHLVFQQKTTQLRIIFTRRSLQRIM